MKKSNLARIEKGKILKVLKYRSLKRIAGRGKIMPLLLSTYILNSCSLSIKVPELNTAKTDLEKQVLGTYKSVDDELILISTVRGSKERGSQEKRLQYALKNQKFNQDDVEELKDKSIVGERNDGSLVLLPDRYRDKKSQQNQKRLRLAKIICAEENRDRMTIWRDKLERNDNRKGPSLLQIKQTYARLKQQLAKAGQWIQDNEGSWKRK
mgnify:CR=1 FL=1